MNNPELCKIKHLETTYRCKGAEPEYPEGRKGHSRPKRTCKNSSRPAFRVIRNHYRTLTYTDGERKNFECYDY